MYIRSAISIDVTRTLCDLIFFFFFQAEDGIRDKLVTGVQTCALPISIDDLLGDGHRPGVGALRGLLLPLCVLDVLFGLERRFHADVGHAGIGQLLADLEHLVGVRLLGGVGEEQRHEHLQLLALHAFADPHGADAALPQDAEDVGEGRVIVEVEAQAYGVHEDELALQPQLELFLDVEQMLRGVREIVERLLHVLVLERVELERAERGVEHDERSEEHTSELQSLAYLVCRLLLEKKKKKTIYRQLYQSNN